MIRATWFATALLVLLPTALPTVAAAQSRGEIRRLCEADFRAHCAGVRPGGGRLLQCAREKADVFSPACLAALESAAAARAAKAD
ncbi:hypothetical protein [Prosthecomicrobium pneumaticum]|uniref:Cysteine rich repeat protein n=1 Tax=Prosthecomicrobium pneumaticum TaxID=81895 RepID=A0A7W9L2H7_9HYPH|nr:hypothetical protein [Prosthecomicrobium pneumaticum]MBB5753534.1 hypothetical protein [Prosthecomicrobium pneumaticum]